MRRQLWKLLNWLAAVRGGRTALCSASPSISLRGRDGMPILSSRDKLLAHRCIGMFQPRIASVRIVESSKPAAANYSHPSIAILTACARPRDFDTTISLHGRNRQTPWSVPHTARWRIVELAGI
ncbi:hypothetical protein ACMFWY_16935 [Roseiconus sp. JC912]|uniref:hypothetical protein n=1 Tax=Roseiconus sp. JC912 TaxID=3396307 RepID=UPI003A4C6E2B